MGKTSWIALLLALVMLATTVPAFAFGAESLAVQTYSEEDYGGLAPPPKKDETPKRPSRPAGEDGGLAPAPVVNEPKRPSRPAGEGDNGGIAPTPTADEPKRQIGRAHV